MKFAQYLRDTQTPEWKRAYIDYRGLKKRIAAIPPIQEDSPRDAKEPSWHGEDHCKASDDRPGTSVSIISPADTTPRSEEVGSTHLTRRRNSTWTKRSSIVQRATSIKSSKSRPMNASQRRSRATLVSLPLREVMALLTPQEIAFFSYLDAQLEKVETFYSNREKELLLRTQVLREQLRGLRDHRNLVHQAGAYNTTCTSVITNALKLRLRSHPVLEIPHIDSHTGGGETVLSPKGKAPLDTDGTRPSTQSGASTANVNDEEQVKVETSSAYEDGGRDLPRPSDPDNYLYAKKKLKKAVLEHYRGLELLHNYRILNLTGFRKALKKFEKVTKIRAQEQYMVEKVDKSALASDGALQGMMKEIPESYAYAFERGNLKKAMHRLRGGAGSKTHHFSTFRSGIFIGLALPALASALYYSSLEETHEDIEAWDALLFIYGVLLVPVVFSILVGLNLLVWARSRVNYTFIFELDTRTRMDYREYFEVPSFLFATLCYASWLSFAQIGSSHISPTIWPLAWLGLVAAILINPLPILYRPSRFWLLRRVGKLFVSGTRRVEFADFWMGDQFCSLVYTLSNLPMFVCVYAEGFSDDWNNCGSRSSHWAVAFGLAASPSLIRLIQSVKRYADSGLITHLINGGKYGFGIINYLFYYLWRHQESHFNNFYAIWLISATMYSTYASSWDLLMDWSLIRPRARNLLLRNDLGYSNHKYLYYFAIVTNCLIRFGWIFYIPEEGPSMLIRSFIVGMLEMMRRVQWNFYRLENEHLGNMDQYRVTREVPLPYTFDGNRHDEEDETSDPHSPTSEKN